jgi:site-specific DNA-methyltransferase (adenine-specific)
MRKTLLEMTRKNAVKLMCGDNLELLKGMPDNCVDSVVTDPPYGLSFMNKKWDHDVPSVEFWKEVLRVLKPGGHVLSFGGTRTYHRMTVNIEDAGFEIRDQIMWLYGSGFPKSHNVGLSIDKLKGHENRGRAIPTASTYQASDIEEKNKLTSNKVDKYETKTEEAKEYEGWGTALKPANEPICVARKPLSEKTVAANVLKWGTGGINIDGCRVGYTSEADKESAKPGSLNATGENSMFGLKSGNEQNSEGRFPANIILDEEAGKVLDEQSGPTSQGHWTKSKTTGFGEFGGGKNEYKGVGPKDKNKDKGGASRFFYCPKVSKKERNEGCEDLEEKKKEFETTTRTNKETADKFGCERKGTAKNTHPTVKPIDLMAYLCRLVTGPQGLVLDPFMGSGSTGRAAIQEGFRFAGMEMDKDYFEIAQKRVEYSYKKKYENGND